MSFFRDLYFDSKYAIAEVGLKIKHPSRPCDFWSHMRGLYNTIFYHPWYCLKRGVRNLVIWFPLIWRNDCWDHTFLTDLMDKQMKEMEVFFLGPHPHTLHAKRDGKRIRWTRKLMQMWKDEHYAMKWYEYHSSKFPERAMFSESTVASRDEWGEPTSYICNPMKEDEREHYASGSDKAHKMDEKVFKLFIKNFSHVRCWWD